MHSFSVASANIAISHILLKTRFFVLLFCWRHYRSIFNRFDVISHNATKFSKIVQNKGYDAIQGRSRSTSLEPIKSHMRPDIRDQQLEMHSVEYVICPIANTTVNELFL